MKIHTSIINFSILAFLFIIFKINVFAQDLHTTHCADMKMNMWQKLNKKSRAGNYDNALMSKYDVNFYFPDLQIERNTTVISGASSIGATVLVPVLDTFCFELNQNLTIDSIVHNNNSILYHRVANITYAILPLPAVLGSHIYVTIYYHGDAGLAGQAAIGDGFSTGTSGLWGNQVTWSLSEPYSAYEWFPCKQFLQDKADSAWVFVTTSDENKAGANGLLEGIDTLPNNKLRFKWKTHYPIDYYLISIAVAKYVDYTIYAHPVAMNGDSIPIVNYVYDNPQTLPFFKNDIDSMPMVLEYYSQLMGLYPFHQEKYGHCMAPFGGGMEHQTMTSIGNLGSFSVNSHELFHHWWGDHVTCKTWKDIFINEGFASYGEYIAYDHFRNHAAAQTKMWNVHDNVMQDPDAQVYFTDTTDVGRIFSKRLTYDKGSAVIHTLRFILGDSLFFLGLKEFQNTFSHSTASINDLWISLETTTNVSLQNFFNQWIYGAGYPVYNVYYYSNGQNIFIKVEHTTSSAITTLFKGPLEIKCNSASGDTIIKVNITQNVNGFVIPSSKIITGVDVDPNNWIINQTGVIQEDPSLISLNTSTFALRNETNVYPNPSKDFFYIENKHLTNASYQLFSIEGKLLKDGLINKNAQINLQSEAKGLYFLQIQNNEERSTIKLIKD